MSEASKITIRLREPHNAPHEIEAIVFGDWAAHGAIKIGGERVPDPTDFVVTHVPTGLTMTNRTGFMRGEVAEALARRLFALGPMPTKESALPFREQIYDLCDEISENDVDEEPSPKRYPNSRAVAGMTDEQVLKLANDWLGNGPRGPATMEPDFETDPEDAASLFASRLLAAEAKCAAMEKVVEAAREVRETDKVWMKAGAPEHGDLANAAATAHVRLEAALDALTAQPAARVGS